MRASQTLNPRNFGKIQAQGCSVGLTYIWIHRVQVEAFFLELCNKNIRVKHRRILGSQQLKPIVRVDV